MRLRSTSAVSSECLRLSVQILKVRSVSAVSRSTFSLCERLHSFVPTACSSPLVRLCRYAGYFIPTPSMRPWLKWIHYVVDPISYSYEVSLFDEVRGPRQNADIVFLRRRYSRTSSTTSTSLVPPLKSFLPVPTTRTSPPSTKRALSPAQLPVLSSSREIVTSPSPTTFTTLESGATSESSPFKLSSSS